MRGGLQTSNDIQNQTSSDVMTYEELRMSSCTITFNWSQNVRICTPISSGVLLQNNTMASLTSTSFK